MQNYIKYLITFVCGVTIMFLLFTVRSTFEQTDSVIIMKDVADAFSAAGMLLLCCAGLVFINNQGMFNMISYSLKRIISAFRRDETKKMHKLYYEYNREQLETPAQFLHLLIVGLIFLLVGVILVSIYYNM